MRVLEPGDVVDGRFLILEEIGKGGMGVVFRALPLEGGRDVALKTLLPRLADEPTSRARFTREVELIRCLKSPHTVAVDALGWDGEVLYYTMELLEGEPLEAFIRQRGRLPAALALRIAAQILQSLTEAHDQGIIHRDLTPSNIFLCRQAGDPYFVKVFDFGLARHLDTTLPRLTIGGMAMGTLPYMAPEQLLRGQLSPATDLYTVGQLLYEMLAGQNIYNGLNNASIIEHKVQGRFPDPKDTPLADPLGAIIIKALQRDPDRRYRTAEQMRQHMAILGRLLPLHEAEASKAPPARNACGTINRPCDSPPLQSDLVDSDHNAARRPNTAESQLPTSRPTIAALPVVTSPVTRRRSPRTLPSSRPTTGSF